ncbi:PREDICTED: uncharacterized protein LOC106813755 [Priapulus caudatus]|uniref:Uncharacterized protein LOC106813755 n=1 Tax=Priapulus caudatus TaxID=37621 RepID=A0ABM1EMP1_PRICU|nr:PREDICTED: uncharacterized protein LOC106813755 [Priapulus caudatus]
MRSILLFLLFQIAEMSLPTARTIQDSNFNVTVTASDVSRTTAVVRWSLTPQIDSISCDAVYGLVAALNTVQVLQDIKPESFSIAGLKTNETYFFYINCQDKIGNDYHSHEINFIMNGTRMFSSIVEESSTAVEMSDTGPIPGGAVSSDHPTAIGKAQGHSSDAVLGISCGMLGLFVVAVTATILLITRIRRLQSRRGFINRLDVEEDDAFGSMQYDRGYYA